MNSLCIWGQFSMTSLSTLKMRPVVIWWRLGNPVLRSASLGAEQKVNMVFLFLPSRPKRNREPPPGCSVSSRTLKLGAI